MTRPLVSTDAWLRPLRQTIREELAVADRAPLRTLPVDYDAEQTLCAGSILGWMPLAQMRRVSVDDMFGDLFQHLFQVAMRVRGEGAAEVSDEDIDAYVVEHGLVVLDMESELAAIRYGNASPPMFRPSDYVDRVLDAARRRRALHPLGRAEALLRTSTGATEEIIEQMRQAAALLLGRTP